MKTRRAGAFTLFELLAVLGMIGLLGFLFLPTLVTNATDARTALCQNSQRTLGTAVANYGADHDGKFPGCQHSGSPWVENLAKYIRHQDALCPERQGANSPGTGKESAWTYALNDFLTPNPYGARQLNFSHRASVPSPAETMMFGEVAEGYRTYDHFHFADAVDNGFTPDAFAEQVDAERHEQSANYLFVDGHVDLLAWSSGARPKLKFRGSRFVHPAGGSDAPQIAHR